MKKYILLIFISLFYIQLEAGGPWASENKSLYAQIGYSFIPQTNRLFFRGRDLYLLNRKVSDQTIQAYVEYGLSNKITLISGIPFKMVATGSVMDTIYIHPLLQQSQLNAFGNVDLELKYALPTSKWKTAIALKTSIPTGKFNDNGLRTGYNTFAVAPTFYIGGSGNKAYYFSRLSYNIRFQLHDEAQIQLEYVRKLWNKSYLIFHFDLLLSTINKNEIPLFPEQTGLYSDGQEYSSLNIKYYHEFKNKFGFVLHSTLINLHGHYVQRSPSLGISVFKKI